MKYTIIGGLNGVGKSTIYSSLSDADVHTLGMRINVDEIVSNIGDWREAKAQYQAGKQAVKAIRDALASRIDFHQETTLAGQTILQTAKTAKTLGYAVHLWYIFVSDIELAKQRVRIRVENGGHGIPDEVIERRAVTSLKTLKALVPVCDEVWLYDNTIAYNLVARVLSGKLSILDKNVPRNILDCFV